MLKFFPKKSVGIDIADHTIEAVEIQKGKKMRLLKMSRIKLEPGIIEHGRIKDKKKLVEAIKKLFREAKEQPIVTKKVVFGLPESQVFIQVLELPKGADINEEVKKNIPLKEEDLLFSYKEPLLVAVSKEVVLEWQEFFKELGIEVELFDIESLATFRGLFKLAKGPICLVDIGAVTTNIAVFNEKGLCYSYSINVAGDKFTNEIAKVLKIKPDEAEVQKIKLGLSDKDSQVFSVLVKELEKILEEIRVALKYFNEKTGQKVEEIVLVGGSSKLQGIVDYFKSNLETRPVRDSENQKKGEEEKISNGVKVRLGESVLRRIGLPTEYIEAIGLALRGLDERQYGKDPAFAPIKIRASAGKPAAKPIKKVKEKKKTAAPSISEIEQAKKLRSKKIVLVIILSIGVILVGSAFWYKNYSKNQKERGLEVIIEQYTKTQSFDLKIPVAVNSTEYTDDRVKGRIIEITIEAAGHYNEAVANARIKAEKELKKGESLWLTPVSPEQSVFPMTIKWVVYSEQGTNELFLKEVDELNKDKIDYALSNIEKTNLEATDNTNIYYLNGKITISLNQLISVEKAEAPEEGSVPEEAVIKIIIKQTETGWLNVRKGPGTGYSILAKIYPGETYTLLEESGNWYKIKIDDINEGWILNKYANKPR